MLKNKTIFLIGPMGAGKSSVGLKLAALLNFEFLDSDIVLQQRFGQSLAELINIQGEANFRRYEQEILAEISLLPNIVLATGGGCILAAHTRSLLQKCGLVCYLKVGLEQQLRRLELDTTRPQLPADRANRREFLRHMQLQRGYLYESIADIILVTDQIGPEAVAQKLGDLYVAKQVQHSC